MNKQHCSGCHDNFYNHSQKDGCWSFKEAKLVWRIPVGMWENPPYKNKKKVLVPNCWHGEGSNRTLYVKPEAITSDGYWK